MSTYAKTSASLGRTVWTTLIGRPLRVSDLGKEQINPFEGLSALSLDALTSVAYGPEAIIVVLALAGAGALRLIVPITLAIVVLLTILVVSYRQVIDAYPGGGGAYSVSRDNLGAGASLVAGAALIVDYTLTVSVSIAAGVGSLTSAFPRLTSLTVPLCLVILAVITLFNLRGLGDSARAFLLPTFMFIVGLLVVIVVGLVHPLGLHEAQPGRSLLVTHGLQVVSVLLILKAFSAGCSALTGVEAIANGVPLFKKPRAKRAKRTEMMLGVILGAMLLGLAILANRWHIGPRSTETVLSQIIAMAVGRHWAYYVVSLTITVVLALAANTSFGGLPILASLLARDNYLPHIFGLRGERQVFNAGIWVLAALSGSLLVVVGGDTNAMIPLFAIGVFTGFTLAQTGLVVHWWRTRPARWRYRASVNATGALVTALATLIFLYSKFQQGAWLVVVAVPGFVFLFLRIHSYYVRTAVELGIGQIPAAPKGKKTLVIVPVTNVSELTRYAISEAMSLSSHVVAITVVVNDDPDTSHGDSNRGEESEPGEKEQDLGNKGDLEREWATWNPGVPLHVLHTPFTSILTPIVQFIDEQVAKSAQQIVVLIPVVVPERVRYRALHNQLDLLLSAALHRHADVVVARVKMPLTSGLKEK